MPDDDALRRAIDELTLRDRFAVAAMQALLGTRGMELKDADLTEVAGRAYDMAEAMLEERAAWSEADVATVALAVSVVALVLTVLCLLQLRQTRLA